MRRAKARRRMDEPRMGGGRVGLDGCWVVMVWLDMALRSGSVF